MKVLFLALAVLLTSCTARPAHADGFRDDCYHMYVGTYISVCSNQKVEVPKESNYVNVDRVIPTYQIQNIYNDSCHCVQQVLVRVN